MKSKWVSWFGVGFLGFVIVVTGCGGGGTGSTQTQGTSQTVHVGPASIRYIGKPQALASTSLGSISVASMAGANFTTFTLSPVPNLSEVAVVFLSSPNTISIVNASTSQSQNQQGDGYAQVLTSPEAIPSAPTFTQDGRILFNKIDSTGKVQIYSCQYDGSSVTQITKTAVNHLDPVTSPNNKTIAFDDGAGHLYTMPLSQYGVETKLAITGSASQPAWAPTSTSLAYVAANSGFGQINTVSLSALTTITPVSKSVSAQCSSPAWSPDGTKLSFDYMASDGTTNIATVDPTSPTNVVLLLGGTGYDVQPSYSPDSKYVLFERGFPTTGTTTGSTTTGTTSSTGSTSTTSTTTGGTIPNLIAATSPDGDSYSEITSIGSAQPSSGANCSSYLPNANFIGTTGTFMTSASGFLWTQDSGLFASFVAYTATTPSKATVTETGVGSPIFDLHADAITALKYSNSYFLAPVAVAPGTGITDVYISLNPNNGQVEVVAPFAVVKDSPRPLITKQGNTTTLLGHFTGVWDAKGNPASSGPATSLTIDNKTGKLLRSAQ